MRGDGDIDSMVRLYNLIYSAAWARLTSQTDKNTSSVFNAEVVPASLAWRGREE